MQKTTSMPFLWWFKLCLVICAFLFGALYVLPSFVSGSKNPLVDILPDSKINLGLDLKGGISLTLNVEVEKAIADSLTRSLNRAKESLASQGISFSQWKIENDLSLSVVAEKPSDAPIIQKAISNQTLLLLFRQFDGNRILFVPNSSAVEDLQKQIMQQAIHTIRNRIDQFGVAEPNIFQAAQTRIVVELPGMTEMERAKNLIGNTAQLDFRLVLNGVSQEALDPLLQQAAKALNLSYEDKQPSTIEVLSQWLRDHHEIPMDSTILLHRENIASESNQDSKTSFAYPYLVEAQSRLTGDLIEDAQAGQTTQNFIPQYVVNLKFKPQGAKIFGELTTAAFDAKNPPHRIAIVLDGNIQSAPVVNGPILAGNAEIMMGSGSNIEAQGQDAQNLALVLRAGALPAAVKVVEERQIGPSEGAQNIRSGIISTVIAAALVITLMVLIYGLSGFVANIAMLFNILLILAFMALFGATLTLPGIAGIVLTMAIAVDGNVVINERIREEIRSGLGQKQAFYKGYETSFRTLIDAHITSAVAGIVLLLCGNPTVKGFAVTLLCGIICTLFTSYYVTQVIGQWLIEKTNFKRFG